MSHPNSVLCFCIRYKDLNEISVNPCAVVAPGILQKGVEASEEGGRMQIIGHYNC